MKRTLRLLAAPAAAMLLLASCGTSGEPAPAGGTAAQEAPQADGEAPEDEQADESDSWPIVEDEDGNVVENPEGDAVDEADESFDPSEMGLEADGTMRLDDEDFLFQTESGAEVRLNIGATPEDDEIIASLESVRETVQGDSVTYIVADVDNRNGVDLINMYNLAMYDADGVEYQFSPADTYGDENWNPSSIYPDDGDVYFESADGSKKMTEAEGREIQHEWFDLIDKLETGVNPSQRATMIMVGPADLPDSVSTVQVEPSGAFDTYYAVNETVYSYAAEAEDVSDEPTN